MNSRVLTKSYLGIILALISFAVGFWFLKRYVLSRAEFRNVVLISIDTCRADYLSCYGYLQKTTPNIDAIAQEGILFKNVVTPVPLTLPAHTSMLSGTIPPYHRIRDNGQRLDDSNVMLAEMLKDNGFVTGAVVGSFVLDSRFGFDQGFYTYADKFLKAKKSTSLFYNERKALEVTQFANAWLQEHKNEKFFLFIHYFDPHIPYEAPEPFASAFSSNRYAGEIAYADYCVGEVVKKLKDLNLYDLTLLIITSDHGESLSEHLEVTHGYFIYQSTLRVPLIFKVPGGSTGKKVDCMVGLIDIMPTICDLLGIPIPPQVQGESLIEYIFNSGRSLAKRSFYCESLTPTKFLINPLFGLLNDRWKYIHMLKPELYDLKKDPLESENLISQQANRASFMAEELNQILQDSRLGDIPDIESELDPTAKRRLESLGYISSGTVDEQFQLDPSKGTAKDLIDLYFAYENVRYLFMIGQYEQARVACEEILVKWPGRSFTDSLFSTVALGQGDNQAVIRHLSPYLKYIENSKSVELASKLLVPEYTTIYSNLGLAFQREGRFEEAIACFKKALTYDYNLSETLYNLGNAYLAQGRFSDSIDCYKKALDIDPDLPKTHCNLGNALVNRGKVEQGLEHYKKALRLNPDKDTVLLIYNCLGRVCVRQNKFDQAISYWSEALKLKPEQPDILNVMGVVLSHQGKLDEAVKKLSKSLSLDPKNAPAHYNLGFALKLQGNLDEAIAHLQESMRLDPKDGRAETMLKTLMQEQNSETPDQEN